MSVTSKTVDAVNRETQLLPIAAERLNELPVELSQFAGVIERVRDRVGFDQDPADFVRARTPAAATPGR